MRRFNPEKELRKIQHGNKNKIIAFVFLLLAVGVIGYSFALYQVRYSKRIIYTKVGEINKDLNLAVYINGKKQKEVPERDSGYKYASIECDDGFPTVEWDEENWNFKQISNINVPNKCNVYFSDLIKEYTLTNKVEEFIIPKSGTYRLEVWGAQGGSSPLHDGCTGGLGGYSVGNIYLEESTVIYIAVGGAGTGDGTHTYQSGGYNGGGDGTPDNDENTRQSSGGGATHIATTAGLLKDLKNNKEDILIVAGGGGGSGANSVRGCVTGGTGGGEIGGNGTKTWSNEYTTGGTQNEPGRLFAKDGVHYKDCDGYFGLGGSSLSGGGGGYYGGGGHYAGGGGSGYLKSTLTKTNMLNGINSGNGKARIFYFGPA